MNCFVARCKHYSVALPRKPAAQPLYNVIAANYINPRKKNESDQEFFSNYLICFEIFPDVRNTIYSKFQGISLNVILFDLLFFLSRILGKFTSWCSFSIGVMLSYGTICVQ